MNDTEILVTGGTGVLGSKVVERLRSAGIEARVLSHSGRPGTIVGDLLTGEGLEEAVSSVDTIVHCASSPFHYARQIPDGHGGLREETDRWAEALDLVAIARDCWTQALQPEPVP